MKKKIQPKTIILITIMVLGFLFTVLSFFSSSSISQLLFSSRQVLTTSARNVKESSIDFDKILSIIERIVSLFATFIPAYILLKKK